MIKLKENVPNRDNFVSSDVPPLTNYFIIVVIVVLFAVGIMPIPIDDQEKIEKAGKVIGILLAMICVLLGFVVLYTSHKTETLNNTPVT